MTKAKPKRTKETILRPVPEASPTTHKLFRMARERGVSMLKVCEEAGVHHDVVGRWRRADTFPTERTLERLLVVLRPMPVKPELAEADPIEA